MEREKSDLEKLMEQIHVCIESSHDELVQIEEVQYSRFIDALVDMKFKIGVIKKKPLTSEKLSDYNVLIIGNPRESMFSKDEIDAIREFVYNGGGLFLLNDHGGDAVQGNNLSEVASQFGISFGTDVLLNHSPESDEDEQLVVVEELDNHFIMRGIKRIALKSACTVRVTDVEEAEENEVAYTPYSTGCLSWNGSAWVETGPGRYPVVAVAKHGAGKVVAIGTTRILSSLINKKHGILAMDNEKFISNILAWLVNREIRGDEGLKPVFVNVSFYPDLYFAIEKELKENDRFRDFNEVINFSVDALFKALDSYRKNNDKR